MDLIKEILHNVKTIAVIGMKDDKIQDAYRIPFYMSQHGYEIYPVNPLPEYVWFQLGIVNDEAAIELEKSGIKVVQDRCLLIEHKRVMS